MKTHLLRILACAAAAIFGCFTGDLCGAAESEQSVLHLANGGYVSGTMLPSEDPAVVRWQSPHFTVPLEFPLAALSAVHYPQPATLPRPQGEYCFELVGDDVIYGDLLGLSDDELEVSSARFGRLQLRRDHVQRFYRWRGEELIYLGPIGMEGWTESTATSRWRDDGGMPFTDKPGASIYGDFGIPEKAVIEFDLAWEKKPDFMLALGVNRQASSVEHAFRFEVWDNQLVAIVESKRAADVASLLRVNSQPGRLRIQAYLDQKSRTMLLYSSTGEAVGSVHIKLGKPQLNPGLRLTNKRGQIRLERLRISRWDGVPPVSFQGNKARLHRSDGTIVYGQLTAFDPDSQELVVFEDGKELRITAATVSDVFLMAQPEKPDASSEDETADTPESELRVAYNDGSRLTGVPTRIAGKQLTLNSPALSEALQLPVADRRSLVAPRHDPGWKPNRKERSGRLEIDGLRLNGRLVGGNEQSEASCLVWLPDLATAASPLRRGISGRIVYRERKPAKKIVRSSGKRVRQPGFGAVFKRMMTSNYQAPPSKDRSFLHLRSGDTIPCKVSRIDESGVTFSTSMSSATFVPHEGLKAIELNAQRSVLGLKKEPRQQLLTLPRLLRDAPPLHLVCSRNADFLRGRILEMDDRTLKIEVRLETKEIPRDRIANLIWFHSDELEDGQTADESESNESATRVQSVRANGDRLTFIADRMENQLLRGESEILGECQVDVKQVDQLLLGHSIEKASADLVFHRWKLRHAKDPKFVQDGATTAGGPTGTESPLVGEPAPDFQLELLEGGQFKLASHRGRVVVLDFWATWCGPCLQTMPIVDEVVSEFAGQGVELVAVNLEEQPNQITSMLERHKLSMNVALDRDGVVAARYAVTAIPQTVVIDREGRVARLFVGGGPKLADPLREVLHELTSPVDQAF